MHKSTYIIVGGKSGGHIIPGLSIAQELVQQENAHIIFVTTDGQLDKKLLKNQPYEHIVLELGAFSRSPLMVVRFIIACGVAVWRMIKLIKKVQPKKIIGMGGISCLPVCLAAYFKRIPFELYELNVIPGKAIAWLAPYAAMTKVCFSAAIPLLPRAQCQLSEYPLQQSVKNYVQSSCKPFDLQEDIFTVLVVGGSQGSQYINRVWIKVAQEIFKHNPIQVIHQAGSHDVVWLQQWYRDHKIKAQVFDFCHDMAPCYTAADLVISRAGAGTLFELLFFKKKTIIIPLVTEDNDHQYANALQMVRMYPTLFTMFEQKQLIQDLAPMQAIIMECIAAK